MKNKNVKRVFAIIMASLLMTTMTACGGNNSNREAIEDVVTTAKESRYGFLKTRFQKLCFKQKCRHLLY